MQIITKKTCDECTALWRHGPERNFKLLPHQKVNQIRKVPYPTWKDKTELMYREYKAKFGDQEFDFLPRSFIIPEERKQLEEAMDGANELWIIKRPKVIMILSLS